MTDLRALLDAATPGPWAIRPRGPEVEFTGSVADADLAVAAVNALPALLDVVDAAKEYLFGTYPEHSVYCGPAGCRCSVNALEAGLEAAIDRLEEVARG